MADHILGVDGPSVTIPTGVLPTPPMSGLTLAPDSVFNLAVGDAIIPSGSRNLWVPCTGRSGVSWVDSAGYITEPGLYAQDVTVVIDGGVALVGYGLAEARSGGGTANIALDLAAISSVYAATLKANIVAYGVVMLSAASADVGSAQLGFEFSSGAGASTFFAIVHTRRLALA